MTSRNSAALSASAQCQRSVPALSASAQCQRRCQCSVASASVGASASRQCHSSVRSGLKPGHEECASALGARIGRCERDGVPVPAPVGASSVRSVMDTQARQIIRRGQTVPRRARDVRNALIGTSASAVGAALLFPGLDSANPSRTRTMISSFNAPRLLRLRPPVRVTGAVRNPEFGKESCGDSKIGWHTKARSAGIQRAHALHSRASYRTRMRPRSRPEATVSLCCGR